MKFFLTIICMHIFFFCQMFAASNEDMQIGSKTEASVSEPYIISDYSPGTATFYAYIENKPEGTNFKWFISGEGWQCIYQYPDNEGAAFDYMGSEAIPPQL